jgi:hypothetical protein
MMSEPADAPLDEVDAAILAELGAAYSAADPPPAELDERVRFAVALGGIEAEVARLSEDLLTGSGARAGEQPRTVTFDAPSLTVMLTIVVVPGGRRRLDGWLAPPAPLRVELRTAGSRATTHAATADDTGRFVVEGVPPGLAQLTVRLIEPGRTVVTPAVVL